jgi:elongation factor Ts
MRYIESYLHQRRIGVLVEFETPYNSTLQSDEFQTLAHDIAMHIVATNPLGIDREKMLRAIPVALRPDATDVEERALLQQAFIKNPAITISELIEETSQALDTTISVTRFVRFDVDDN